MKIIVKHMIWSLLITSSFFTQVFAQQINLDKIVKAGELTLFQELKNKKAYYYISDKPHIGINKDGQPQFSFLRYVDNIRSGADKSEIKEGEGGGIVHALIELGVTEEQRKDAQRELRRKVPGAVLKGPVMYRSGTVALISSVVNKDGGLSESVLGMGKAPILDGEKVAVSILLTKKGAKILWESFKTPTPDMSISFEMELEGYRSPKEVTITADFEQVYKHKDFQAGLASEYLSADIRATFDDLTKKGAIKVEQIGEDEDMETAKNTAYNKLIAMMFDQADNGQSAMQTLAAMSEQGKDAGAYDRAAEMLKSSREETREINREIQKANAAERARVDAVNAEKNTSSDNSESEAKDKPDNQDVKRPVTGYASRQPLMTNDHTRQASPADISTASSAKEESQPQKEINAASFTLSVSYKMKTVRQKGSFKIDLRKYTTDIVTTRFDENFGKIDCKECFHQVNLDDPLYKQRELVAMVNGANAENFGNFINFAAVTLRKTHQSGEITNDEVRIDRKNFNAKGNNFKMLYGWKGDNDRSKWFDYEYKTTWNFFGGSQLETEWVKSNLGVIDLSPPYLSKKIEIEGGPEALNNAGVRAVDVKIYNQFEGKELSEQFTFRPGNDGISEKIEVLLPNSNAQYDYEIEWRLTGNQVVKSKRMTTAGGLIFIDELP